MRVNLQALTRPYMDDSIFNSNFLWIVSFRCFLLQGEANRTIKDYNCRIRPLKISSHFYSVELLKVILNKLYLWCLRNRFK